MIELRGISWDHPRGHDAMVATVPLFQAEHPAVRVDWQTRSLRDFGEFPVQVLAERYDLLVIDHPFVGFAAEDGCLLPLDDYLDPAVLSEQAANSVGGSHASYWYGGHQWALANDAAAHVAAYRPDLLDRIGGMPATWRDVLDAARRGEAGEAPRVAVPLVAVDAIMVFCSLSVAIGEPPFATPEVAVSRTTGRQVLAVMRQLQQRCHPASLDLNPPGALDLMSTTDEVAYIPLLFGYSNYARPGFRRHLVRFSRVPSFADQPQPGGILGGAGIAVSRRTAHPREAADYAAFVTRADIQRGPYFAGGGQPGHRLAWLDDAVNAASSNFFRDTLAGLDDAYVRPRYAGYQAMQEEAGERIHAWLREESADDTLLGTLDDLYRASNPPAASSPGGNTHDSDVARS